MYGSVFMHFFYKFAISQEWLEDKTSHLRFNNFITDATKRITVLRKKLTNIFGPPKRVYGQYLTNNSLHSLYTHVK